LRSLLAIGALTVASVALALAMTELVARVVWKPPSQPAPRSLPPELRDLPELHGMFDLARKNVRGVHHGVLYETNRYGFRGREFSRNHPPEVFRIVFIGDSYTMGSGVSVEDIYPTVVERRLNAKRGDRRYEVLNLGLGGLNLDASLWRLIHIGLQFKPDMIVYGFTINDLEGPHYRSLIAPLETAPRDLYDSSPLYLLRWLWPRWVSLRELVNPSRGSYLFELNENYFHNPPAWNNFLAGLDKLARIGRRKNVCVTVLIHTHLFFLHPLHPLRRHYEMVADATRKRGLYAKTSLPYYYWKNSRALWVAPPADSHPNAAGHEILAQALLDGLDELPDSCWE